MFITIATLNYKMFKILKIADSGIGFFTAALFRSFANSKKERDMSMESLLFHAFCIVGFYYLRTIYEGGKVFAALTRKKHRLIC